MSASASRRAAPEAVSGWIALDKPRGVSSAKAVYQTRRLLRAAKAGHAGTLDPLADGILLIALGEATKAAGFLTASDKIYRFTIRWGAATDTDDQEGRVIRLSASRPSPSDIDAALPRFIGVILQRPPAFSAIHCQGRRAYLLARQGRPPRLAPREARIFSLRRLSSPSSERTELEMRCGSGVYVRSVARDLGEALESAAHVEALRRIALGPFGEKDAIPLEELAQEARENLPAARARLLPLEKALSDMPALAVSAEEARALRQGQRRSLRCRPAASSLEGATCLALHDGKPVGFVEIADGEISPKRIFHL